MPEDRHKGEGLGCAGGGVTERDILVGCAAEIQGSGAVRQDRHRTNRGSRDTFYARRNAVTKFKRTLPEATSLAAKDQGVT